MICETDKYGYFIFDRLAVFLQNILCHFPKGEHSHKEARCYCNILTFKEGSSRVKTEIRIAHVFALGKSDSLELEHLQVG